MKYNQTLGRWRPARQSGGQFFRTYQPMSVSAVQFSRGDELLVFERQAIDGPYTKVWKWDRPGVGNQT